MENEKILKMTNAVYALLDLFPDEEPLKNRTKEKALAVLDDLISVSFLTGLEKEKIACQAVNGIEMLLGHLGLANRQGYLSKLNLIIISEEYKKTIQDLKPIADAYKQKQDPVLPKKEEPRKWSKISELLPVVDAAAPAQETSVLEKEESPKSEEPALVSTQPKKKNSPSARDFPKGNNRQEKIIQVLQERGKIQVADLKQILPDVTKRTLRRDLDSLLKQEKISRVGEWNQTFYQIRTS